MNLYSCYTDRYRIPQSTIDYTRVYYTIHGYMRAVTSCHVM